MQSVAVIGAGFYGTCLALLLRAGGLDVRLFEKEHAILQRASSRNQARIHGGYHYPRNLVTAFRSFVNMPRFASDFREAVVDDFTSLYCVARTGSRTSAAQFQTIYNRMGAYIRPAKPGFRALFTAELIEEVFEVKEFVFDHEKLKTILEDKLRERGISPQLDSEITRIEPGQKGGYRLVAAGGEDIHTADLVFNCTYSAINTLRRRSGFLPLHLKHEFTELAVIEVPDSIARLGITVMDGPFFSILPYPPRHLHTFSHVRYAPHRHWTDGAMPAEKRVDGPLPQSNFLYMMKDASRYMPALARASYRDSIFETKTILADHEVDDGRPILFHEDRIMPGYYDIMGGKIDNIYDVFEAVLDARRSIGLEDNNLDGLFRHPTISI